MKSLSKGRYMLVLISMCGVIACSLGLATNVAGLFFDPVAKEFGILRGSVSLTLTLTNLIYPLGGFLVFRLIDKLGIKPALIVMSALVIGSTAALAFAQNIIVMYVICAVRGIASGMFGIVFATTIINRWFYKNAGLFTSIAMAFSGLAGAVFSPMISGVIQAAGWRQAYLFTALLAILCCLPSILFVPSADPHTIHTAAYGEQAMEAETERENHGAKKNSDAQVDRRLFILVSLFPLAVAAATAFPQHFPGVAEAYGKAASVGALMLSITMLMNSLGKILYGILSDHFGTRISISLYCVLITAGLLVMIVSSSALMMYICCALIGLSYGASTVGVVSLTKDTFGMEAYDKVYPVLSMGGNISNALMSTIIGYMYDFTGGYLLPLGFIAVMTACSAGLVQVIFRKKTSGNR